MLLVPWPLPLPPPGPGPLLRLLHGLLPSSRGAGLPVRPNPENVGKTVAMAMNALVTHTRAHNNNKNEQANKKCNV